MELKELREQKNLKQIEVAQNLNVNRTTYRSWEKGINEPSIENLIKIADFYGTSIDRLVNRQYFNVLFLDNMTNMQKKVVQEIIKLEPIQLAQTQGFLNALTGNITIS
jgi:transcriptional regulator with XRE-family HTH domain